MISGIRLRAGQLLDDDDFELDVVVSSGQASFIAKVFTTDALLRAFLVGLKAFAQTGRSGIFNFQFGEFGPEYAMGAAYLRFHFPQPGKLCITVRMESAFGTFGKLTVADTASLHVQSQLGLIDAFIGQLDAGLRGRKLDAYLEGIPLEGQPA